MRSTPRRAPGPLIACVASILGLHAEAMARAQEPAPKTVVDGVVAAACQKQIVLLGELPTHGEAQAYDAKSRIVDKLMASSNRSLEARDRVMLESFARYAERQVPGVTTGREESMYRNLVWYLQQLPAKSRVVIWTATVHAARRGSPAEPPLGARVVERWGDRAIAVGFTAFGGRTSRAGRPASPISDAPPGSLEARATSEFAWALPDSDQLRSLGRVPSRLLGEFRL